jgi:hypothetical protein
VNSVPIAVAGRMRVFMDQASPRRTRAMSLMPRKGTSMPASP